MREERTHQSLLKGHPMPSLTTSFLLVPQCPLMSLPERDLSFLDAHAIFLIIFFSPNSDDLVPLCFLVQQLPGYSGPGGAGFLISERAGPGWRFSTLAFHPSIGKIKA